MTGSRLFNAILVGADLRGASLEGVDLTGARLESAVLAETHLEASQLRGASVAGAILSNSWLQGATSLVLNGVILRKARLNAVDFCERADPKKGPTLSDLREADFATPADWNAIKAKLRDGARSDWKVSLGRLEAALRRKETCLAGKTKPEDLAHRRLLYEEGPLQSPMSGWPPSSEQGLNRGGGWSEDEFSANLATALWDQACEDTLLAQVLVIQALGGRPPSDPLINMHLAFNYMQRQGMRCEDEGEKEGASESLRGCPGLSGIDNKDRERIIDTARSSPLCSTP
jgi:uncharacterized protein YjbI with pentapeptide repeats